MRRCLPLLVSLAILVPSVLFAQTVDVPLRNWTVPPYTRASGGIGTMTDVTSPRVFVGVAPCRIADTRGLGFSGQAGPPALTISTRTFQISGTVPGVPAQCGIPVGTEAVSFQFTIVTPNAAGNLVAWPGGAAPTISVLNWDAGAIALGNGTIVPLSVTGSLSVQINAAVGNATAHLVIDVNGYFSDTLGTPENHLLISNNSSAYSIFTVNNSTTCVGPCGIRASVQSTAGAHAISGYANGASGVNYGVYGEASSSTGSGAGVRGVSPAAATSATYGVFGETNSTSTNAGGVYGLALQGSANGGYFSNLVAGPTFISTQADMVNYGVYTFAKLRGASLDIVGGTKNFVSPHPKDPTLEIRYASVEAPTVDVYFRGTGTLANGYARIEVPDHFRFTAREGTYMTTLTPVGRPVALSVEAEGAEGILVRGTGSGRFHYVVYAERAEIEGYEAVTRNRSFTPALLERGGGPERLPESTRARLVENGTLNPDGSYNVETARTQGWTIPEKVVPEESPQP